MAPCLMRPFSAAQCWRTRQLHFLAPIHFALEKAFSQLKDSNNPLAVELERENDPAPRNIFRAKLCQTSFQLKRLQREQQGFIQMFNALRRTAALWASMVVILFAAVTAAYSQAPTDAQRSAIRSQCRSDYEAHCASVPPGGKASLQCLQKNMSSLSSGCQAAVRAVEAPAAPKAETAPAAPKANAPAAPAEATPAASTAKPAAETAAPPAGLRLRLPRRRPARGPKSRAVRR